jgi:dihydroorotate dehydrogenase
VSPPAGLVERAGLALLHRLDPERAHGAALAALRAGLAGGSGPVSSPRLATRLAGLDLPNPVGTAAGFDKAAVAVDATLRAGFGFAEIGAVTPRGQPGNPRPRLFRLDEDRAAINRFGFNSAGMETVHASLLRQRRPGPVGVNLGANRDSADKAADYLTVLGRFRGDVAFATVNVSSPNTERLRDLQGRAALDALLARVLEARDAGAPRIPVFLKIAPDLDDAGLRDIAEVCMARGVDGIIATNTTTARDGLTSALARETGGLSGAPLFRRSTEVLAALYRLTGGALPLVGAGGIASPEDALAKIRAGASAVQLYTAMIFEGVSLGARIARGLDRLLAEAGAAHVLDAVGADVAVPNQV